MATNSSRLNLTRDQLASFLTDHQQIKQFEMLFSAVDAIAPNVVLEINIAVGTAQATANNAIDQIIALGQDMAVNDAAMSAKVQQALDAIPRLAQALELLASAPVGQPQAAAFDDLRSRDELGTMAAQNAEKVAITGGTIAGITFGGFPAGTVSLPSLYWSTDTTTGFYRIGANNIGYSISGVKAIDIEASGSIGFGNTVGDIFARGYTKSIGITSAGSTALQINAATGFNPVIDLGVNGARTLTLVGGAAGSLFGTVTATTLTLISNGATVATFSSTGVALPAGVLTTLGGATFHTTSTALTNGAGAGAGGGAGGGRD